MKFSGNLFKIQAKISTSAFILMGSVCHLGAMENLSAGEFAERLLVGTSNFGTPVQDSSESKTAGCFRKGNTRNSLPSDGSLTPTSPFVTRVGHTVLTDENSGDALGRAVLFQNVRNKGKTTVDTFRNPKKPGEEDEQSLDGLVAALKDSPNRSKLFNGSDSRSSALNITEQVGQSNRAKIKARLRQSAAGRGAGKRALGFSVSFQDAVLQEHVYGSPEQDKSPAHTMLDVVKKDLPEGRSPGYISPIRNPSVLIYGSSEKSPAQEAIGNALSAAVMDEQVVELDTASNQGTMVLRSRAGALATASGNAAELSSGRRLDFTQDFDVQGDNALTLFDPNSIFSLSREDEITLHIAGKEVKTTIGDVLAKKDTGEASKVLRYLVHYSEYQASDESNRKQYLKDLLDLSGYVEHGLTKETVLPFLRERVLSSASFLPSFFKSSVQKINRSAALIERALEDSRIVLEQNSSLRTHNQALIQSLRHVFADSELSAKYQRDYSKEMISFDTSEWSAAQFSQCLQFVMDQYITSRDKNTELTQNNTRLTKGNEKLINEVASSSARADKLVDTVADLSKSKSELEGEIRSDQKVWHEKELDFVRRIEQLELEKQDAIQQALIAEREVWQQEKQDAIQQAVMAERDARENEKTALREKLDLSKRIRTKLVETLTSLKSRQFVTDLLRDIK